jgi:biotin carboxylase
MKAKVAIAETVIIGPETNLEFLYQILNNRDFNNDQIDIEFLDRLTSGDGLNG